MAQLADRIVILDGSEAARLVDLLDSFERLLRFGGLSRTQQELVAGAAAAAGDAGWHVAGAVLDVAGAIRQQLGSPIG